MVQTSDIRFKISDGKNLIQLEPIQAYDIYSSLDKNKNCIQTKVILKGGAFNGQFIADFETTDFELLKRDFKNLDKNFNEAAKLEPLEKQLVLNIVGDGIGHFEVSCFAHDQPINGATISFSLIFDQTELGRLINELDRITKAFPIEGDFIIKNK